ncbi:hypothetical protein TUMSATVNIG1_57360 (plasmid) [Vibrio nigripulchritudo]|uniref:hypothetical protein n=1 Tax=Vibrio nigripulchritudo TaxID=28173 RepID=UPI00190BF2CD|nr:hypothetical protein [Vibrio nigripulchritudo]BCL73751.1 hypothetical protein VNTUMSATTG_56880 [Vibrio nigripulchritudo]BDU35127.1 hypothetical protein TUMSATVNIG1_57360 [Vibrio nigripulchritudo]
MTYVFAFTGNSVRIHKIDAPNASVGETGPMIGQGKIGETVALPDGVRAWTGGGQGPFFGNGIGLAKFNAAKQKGQFAPELFKQDGELFVGATASFVVIDVPNRLLGEQVNVFATTAVRHKGEWSQVD